jgi:hypothetical protein
MFKVKDRVKIAKTSQFYGEIDSIFPIDNPTFAFLGGKRLKTKKLRGQISQGIAFPLTILGNTNALEGEDFTDYFGITKYEPQLDSSIRGLAKGNFPIEIPKTECERIQNRKKILYLLMCNMFVPPISNGNSVKSLFGQIKDSILSSFDLPTLGNSVNSITRNISKLLERTKNFARNISQLSGLGLNSALLQQVIQAGPMAGSQLAAALVSGGGSFISQINRAYGEFGDLAGGIAGTGTMGAFAGHSIPEEVELAKMVLF